MRILQTNLKYFIKKLFRYAEAAPQLEIIFYIREKLVTICHVSVMECLIELVACLAHMEVNIKYLQILTSEWELLYNKGPGN